MVFGSNGESYMDFVVDIFMHHSKGRALIDRL